MEFTSSWKWTAVAGIIGLAVGFGSARLSTPEKVVTKTEVVEKVATEDKTDKIVTKTTVKEPDGTLVTQEKTEDVKQSERISVEDVKVDKEVTNKKPNWMVSGSYGLHYDSPYDRVSGLAVQRRVIGNIFVGTYAMTNKNIGLTIGLEF